MMEMNFSYHSTMLVDRCYTIKKQRLPIEDAVFYASYIKLIFTNC